MNISTKSLIAAVMSRATQGSKVAQQFVIDAAGTNAPFNELNGLLEGHREYTVNGENIVVGAAKTIVKNKPGRKAGAKNVAAVAA